MNNTMSTQTIKKLERASVEATARKFAGKEIRTTRQLNEFVKQGIYSVCEKPIVNKIVIDPSVNILEIGNSKVVRTVGTNSPMSCSFDYYTKEMSVELEGYSLIVGGDTGYYATTDFVYISCKDCESDVKKALLERVLHFGLYKMGKTVLFPEYKDNNLVALRIGSPYGKAMEGNPQDIINNTKVAFYTFFNASPAQERNADLVGIDAKKYNVIQRYGILNDLMGGGISSTIGYELSDKDIEAIENGVLKISDLPEYKANITKKDAMKLPTRVAQQNTASMYLNSLGNEKFGVMYVQKKLSGGVDFVKEVMDALSSEYGINIDNQITDGQAFGLEDIVIDAFKEHGITVKRAAVRCSAFQTRTEGLNDKVFTLFISKMMMTRIAKTIIEKYGEENIIIVGNPNNIAYIVDSNACKLPNFWRMNRRKAALYGVEYGNFKMAILAPASSSQAKSSLQAIGKIKSDEVKDSLVNNFYDMLGGSMMRVAEGKLPIDGKATRVHKFFAANNDRSTSSVATLEMLVRDIANQGFSAIRKVKVPVSGFNGRVFFDNTHLILGNDDASVLKVVGKTVQAYSSTACNMFRKELAEIKAEYDEVILELITKRDSLEMDEQAFNIACIVAKSNRTAKVDKVMTSFTVKYPCPTDIEFAQLRYLAWFEVVEIIEEMQIADYEKELLKELYGSLKDGIVMIAPLNSLKHRLAGMDTDYDGITSFFEAAMVNSAKVNDNGDVVYIGKEKDEEKLSPYYTETTNKNTKTSETVISETYNF